MRYKISNTAQKEHLEHFTGLPLKYPNLYTPSSIITGFEETILPIITSNNAAYIEYGIWGLLPDNYNDDWVEFQNIIDTLTITLKDFRSNALYKESVSLKRCVIVVTGFFTSYLHNGEMYPYYVYNSSGNPIYLAGYFNSLTDGFLTFTILLSKASSCVQKIQNISDYMPKVLSCEEKDIWLNDVTPKDEISSLTKKDCSLDLKAHPIAKELYKMGISYNSMLEPAEYQDIPRV